MQKENELAKKLVNHYGGRHFAAKALRVHPETVRLWMRDGIPLEKAVEVEQRSKGFVTAEQILVDVKGRMPQRRHAPARARA